jgi:UDP-N-acetylglucosamine diphosphorylase/glucosamine-1-phosphate N-acetyltransferase
MNVIFFDTQENHKNLLPLTFTRPISEFRIGILKISEKWQKYLQINTSSNITEKYLQKKYPFTANDKNLLINSALLPNQQLAKTISQIPLNHYLEANGEILAIHTERIENQPIENIDLSKLSKINYEQNFDIIKKLWHIFQLNGQEIEKDFHLLTQDRQSMPISSTNLIVNPQNIFIEEGAEVECSVLNAQNGYIYIGKNAQIMENTVVRGSLALCENAVLKVRTTIYGPTTIGPYSKFGGENNNIVVFGYSNKAHDGFLGNSVIGEWCNFGAGTNNSNLKNNYAEVKLWNYALKRFEKTGLQFCGLIMADHSKCGISTTFNTGTVVGVSANIFGAGFPRNFIPSFSWGGAHGFIDYKFEKAIETAKKVVARRNIKLTEIDIEILKNIFNTEKKLT